MMFVIEIPTRNGQLSSPPVSLGFILRLPAWMVSAKGHTFYVCGYRCCELDD